MSSDRYLRQPPPPKHPPDGDNLGPSLRGCLLTTLSLILVFGVSSPLWAISLTQTLFKANVPPGEARDLFSGAPASAPVSAASARSRDRLQQIMQGMQKHHENFRTFPPPPKTAVDKDGKQLLSWRVHLLPFIDQEPLYKQFHLDEPWNSPRNRKLLDKMPDVYRSRGISSIEPLTGFVLFDHPAMYDISMGGPAIQQIRDGTSNTLLVVEASPELAVPWTRPTDISFNPAQPLNAIGALPADGFWGGFADGTVRRIRPDIKPDLFRALLTAQGGEPVIEIDKSTERH
ncbi:MAG: DUF1559 domain-containing protein [Planctomycetales bacterium]